MERKFIKILLILALTVGNTPAFFSTVKAQETASVNNVNYTYKTVKENEAVILKVETEENTLVIPEQIDGNRVTVIEKEAVDSTGMIAVKIPETVFWVKPGAFYNCNEMVELDIPAGCNAADGFEGLIALRELYISGSGAMFDYDSAFAVPWNDSASAIQSLYLSDDITHIGAHSFEGLVTVREIIFPTALQSIGEYGCYNMQTVRKWAFPDSLTVLEKGAMGMDQMDDYNHVVEVVLPEKLESIGEKALSRQGSYYAYRDSAGAEYLRNQDIPFKEIGFRLTEEEVTLNIGDEYQLSFQDTPQFLRKNVTFTSDNEKAVEVTSDGHLWAYGQGSAVITADNGTASTSIKINVRGDSQYETRLLRLPEGTVQYAINLADFGLAGKQIRSISADSNVVNITDDNGLETVAPGKGYVYLETDGKTVRYLVEVYKPVSTVVPELEDFVMLKGTSFKLGYRVYPSDAAEPNVLFSSADPSVVSVNSEGYLTAESEGETEISLTPRDGYKQSGTVKVKVVGTEMSLPLWSMPLMKGRSFRFSFPDKGDLHYYSSDSAVATVSDSGLMKATGNGECDIYVYNEVKTEATWIDVRIYDAFSNGIDVSEWQDTLTLNDWIAIKNYGIDFAILRAGYADYYEDSQFENNYEKAREAGLQLGVYHYIEALTVEEARAEARAMLNWISGKKFEYPVFIDIEAKEQRYLSSADFSAIVDAYGQILTEAGWKVGVYSFASLLDSMVTDEVLAKYDVWQAHWSVTKPSVFEKPYTIWQYTSEGSVTGISGRCDMNICFFDYPTYIKNNHLNGY